MLVILAIHQLAFNSSTSLYVTLIHSTITIYIPPSILSLTLHHSTLSWLYLTWLYISLQWLCISIHGSTSFYCGSTWLYITLYHGYTSLSLTRLHSTMTLHHSTMALIYSPWLYFILYYGSIWLYITLQWLYFTPFDSTSHYHGSTSLLDTFTL